ncbi:indoleamine 2,3-dioxygenase 2 isoform X6 [Macaca thibetana thibetana]|uniref:indoleamine 2,3-dioxygenase 2 isoform X6 n=1 Tax=Macaca thibetana thibetana TaxID=257877 RepID=UPI0021BC7055|nr:indoleamine 2,3-dioxygenase 2 isoform X6 [Macaca thibetana thibetana]XP_050657303.1 indoleamine 2,3-dioxygenase 2 isoform X6 [Macaca thibetana thibetana]
MGGQTADWLQKNPFKRRCYYVDWRSRGRSDPHILRLCFSWKTKIASDPVLLLPSPNLSFYCQTHQIRVSSRKTGQMGAQKVKTSFPKLMLLLEQCSCSGRECYLAAQPGGPAPSPAATETVYSGHHQNLRTDAQKDVHSPDMVAQACNPSTLRGQDHVDPDIFYSVIRIFLSGWKDNPAMPAGLMYEGVSKEPLKYSGGSAAQSTVLHAFDEFLGIRHSKESADFLYRMRDYMPPSHKAFIEDIHSAPSLRDYVLSSGQDHLLTAYNQCVQALVDLRSYHITMVTRYLITAAAKAKRRKPNHLPGPPQALEDRGTGGTAVMSFLKSVRDKTLESILHPHG